MVNGVEDSKEQAAEPKKKKMSSKQRMMAFVSPIVGVTMVSLLFFMLFGEDNFFASDDVRERTYSTEERIYMMGDGNIVRAEFAIEVTNEEARTSLINGRKVIDWILSNAISEFDLERISGKSGKEALENEIKGTINRQFPSLQIERVYITSLVIT
ncbi:flagellar basal body-associated FliL family protein [Salisediminibacterium beveridgei]|uniref:Flagellar protein FliL n=1 Tax=Salisediminibacterium beveridgei TaxID=632773 RepID=A0A1D7QVA2_9BACI|nr:flagellar basal body-associated FliL family protein [Salisediminibacterium beveridgei]AOM82940.1 Flagellar Basal Body-Associated Protein FliL [Salisediminibacterium beveridgei]